MNVYMVDLESNMIQFEDMDRYEQDLTYYYHSNYSELILIEKMKNTSNQGKLNFYTKEKFLEYKIHEDTHYRIYTINFQNNEINTKKDELSYLQLLKDIMSKGDFRQTRNGFTYSLFGKTLSFDVRDKFPLLTTKRMFFRGIIEELLFFLRGETNSKLLENKGVNIWKGNTSNEFIRSRNLPYEEGDMGPMYGYQWIHFGAKYRGMNAEYGNEGYNQLEYVIKLLREDPMSRRIIMTTYNPEMAEEGVLYPCHGIVTQFYVNELNNNYYVSIQTYLRSNDMFLGSPFNIASYAAMLYIICQYLGPKYKPDRVIMNIGDAHIYEEHIEQCLEQIKRQPYSFPKLRIREFSRIEDLRYDDFELVDYKYHSVLTAPMKV